jgi:hypothetical protein
MVCTKLRELSSSGIVHAFVEVVGVVASGQVVDLEVLGELGASVVFRSTVAQCWHLGRV